jgi:hypothetical protein
MQLARSRRLCIFIQAGYLLTAYVIQSQIANVGNIHKLTSLLKKGWGNPHP